MSVLLEIAPPPEIEKEVSPVVDWAESLVILTPDDCAAAAARLKDIKGIGKRIADWFSPLKKSADAHKKSILDAERTLLEPLAQAERLAKNCLLSYQQAEEAKRREEQRRLQAIADEKAQRERQKAEQEAAKQRAIEAEARAKADQARREAEQADAAERKRLLAAADAAERKAEAANIKAEAKQETAASIISPLVQVTKPQAPAGLSMRKIWKAEIVDLAALLAFVHEHKRDDLILPNEKVIEAYGRAMKEQASIPGVRFFLDETLASRSN